MLKLAKSQKMNTDIRKSIFIALMGGEDYVDSFERILKLNLKDKQERDIIRVLVHCCLKEKTFNPFYGLVAQRFCLHAHAFIITFQYTLWDAIRIMADPENEYQGTIGLGKLSRLAQLYAFLMTRQLLPLTILKAIFRF